MSAVSRTPVNFAGLRAMGALRQDTVVRTEPLLTTADLPIAVRPRVAQLDVLEWARSNRAFCQPLLLKHGALLFRGFEVADLSRFEAFVQAVSGDPLEYMEQSSPRGKLHNNIYTSTEYPPQHSIFLHNENSYQSTWPRKILFYCDVAPESGGETPIADVRRVLGRIPEPIRERFRQQGWMLTRNFGTGFGLTWQTAFQTSDRDAVTQYCGANGIECQWLSEQRLRIRRRRTAITRHPETGELVWFNHATFFHVSTLEADVRDQLLAELSEEDLPCNTYYGDGSAIEPETLDALRAAYEAETIRFGWQQGDILLLDNMLVAHGRAPYSGARRIAVGMTEPYAESEPDSASGSWAGSVGVEADGV